MNRLEKRMKIKRKRINLWEKANEMKRPMLKSWIDNKTEAMKRRSDNERFSFLYGWFVVGGMENGNQNVKHAS